MVCLHCFQIHGSHAGISQRLRLLYLKRMRSFSNIRNYIHKIFISVHFHFPLFLILLLSYSLSSLCLSSLRLIILYSISSTCVSQYSLFPPLSLSYHCSNFPCLLHLILSHRIVFLLSGIFHSDLWIYAIFIKSFPQMCFEVNQLRADEK